MSQGKRTLKPFILANALDLSANATSSVTVIENLDRALLHIKCTGTPTGTVAVQGSVDYDSQSPNAASWFDLPLNLDALAGSAQDYVIDILETAIRALRINYTSTSGTGSMTATISAKES
jgi:hypothetical protein